MSILILLLAGVITVPQGKAFQVKAPHVEGIQSVQLQWQNKKVPYVRVGQEWVAVVGVDLDVKAGSYPSIVEIARADGVRRETIEVRVSAVRFPTTRLTVEERFVQLNPRDQARANEEAREIQAIQDAIAPEILWSEPFRSPIEGITTGNNFGHRRVFNNQPRNPHNGADLRASTGTRILSANRGRVALAKDLFFTGNTVIIDHGLGIYTLYAHLSRIDVKQGSIVDRGQLLGLAGATGRVTGPHLHWGARIQGARVDPFSLTSLAKP